MQATRWQREIDLMFENSKPYPFNHPRALELTKHLTEMIALDIQPFSIVSDVGFLRYTHKLDPRYQVPSDKYFRCTAMPEMYVKVKSRIAEIVEAQTYISITTDIWTSRVNDAYMSITAHFVTDMLKEETCACRLSHLMKVILGKKFVHVMIMLWKNGK